MAKWLTWLVALAPSLLLAACESPENEACDRAIKATLKAPSSFRRISNDGVHIEYDAVNSYNAPLRGRGICVYDKSDKSAQWIETGFN